MVTVVGMKLEIPFVDQKDSVLIFSYNLVLRRPSAKGSIDHLLLIFLGVLTHYLFRCEALMRLAEKELVEMEKKKQQSEAAQASNNTQKSQTETTKQRIAELSRQIADESKKLSAVRVQMEKLKKGDSSGSKSEPKEKVEKEKDVAETKEVASKVDSVGEKEKEKKSKVGGSIASPVPESLFPALCRYVYIIYYLLLIVNDIWSD